MKLQGVFDDQQGYEKVELALLEKFNVDSLYKVDTGKVFSEFTSQPGHAHCMYSGVLGEEIELTELELAMICDGGYSFFGGFSTIHSDGTFVVKIYTD